MCNCWYSQSSLVHDVLGYDWLLDTQINAYSVFKKSAIDIFSVVIFVIPRSAKNYVQGSSQLFFCEIFIVLAEMETKCSHVC